MTNETNPLAATIASVDDEEILERAEVEDLIYEYDRWRAQESSAKAEKEKAGERIKEWLNLHPNEAELHNGERGLKAFFRTSTGPERYDVAAMPRSLVGTLHKANALQVDVGVLRALAGKAVVAEDVKPYRVPGLETRSLQVVKE